MRDNMKNELAITEDEQILKNYKSIYYMLNAKPDSISRAFSKRSLIGIDDLIDLNERIKEKVQMNYNDDGYIATVTVNFSNKRCIDFRCWEEFLQHNWTENYCVESIILKWNFNIRIPQYPNPQNHKLVVKITNGLRFEEFMNFIFSGHMEDFNEMEMETSPILARVDFINTLLGDEVLNIVKDWVDGLEASEIGKNKVILFARKYRKIVARLVEYISFFMFCFLGVSLLCQQIQNMDVDILGNLTMHQCSYLVALIVMFAVVCSIIKKLSYIIAKSIYNGLEEYGEAYTFKITKGDEKKQKNIQKMDKYHGVMFCVKIVFSGVFNIVCGILSTILIGGM